MTVYADGALQQKVHNSSVKRRLSQNNVQFYCIVWERENCSRKLVVVRRKKFIVQQHSLTSGSDTYTGRLYKSLEKKKQAWALPVLNKLDDDGAWVWKNRFSVANISLAPVVAAMCTHLNLAPIWPYSSD